MTRAPLARETLDYGSHQALLFSFYGFSFGSEVSSLWFVLLLHLPSPQIPLSLTHLSSKDFDN